ncbi:hypothetical protein OSTOST_10930, partial [Ostertagia ostertagi]
MKVINHIQLQSAKFDLLRMLLSKMRENVEEMGLTGDMQVHVIEVKPIPNKMPQQSIDDAFGEVAMPRQAFGQWRNSDEENNEIMNRWDGPQWGQENRWPQENHMFEPFQDAPGEPQDRSRIINENQTPQRVVTELFGNTAPEVIGHMLGQKNPPAQPWPQPWAMQPQMWDQPHWDQPLMPQQAPPMVYFFNPMPQPQQQFQQQPPPPPVFQPIANQNQFPLPVQNQLQAAILPQPFPIDNNNNVNAFNENAMKPWYMSGDDQRWQQTWENNNKNTAVVGQGVVPQPAPEQPAGHDSDGIDGFPRE